MLLANEKSQLFRNWAIAHFVGFFYEMFLVDFDGCEHFDKGKVFFERSNH
jgi:hypothetical protein